MKALYYQPYSSLLILTPKAFKRVKHLTEHLLVSSQNGFFLIRSGCPFYYLSYDVQNKESFCSGCKSRLKREMGHCSFSWKPEKPELYSFSPILALLAEKKIPSDEAIYHTYTLRCDDEFDGFADEQISLGIFAVFLLLIPLLEVCIYLLKGFEWIRGLFTKKRN